MHAASLTVWIERETEEEAYAELEKVLDAIQSTDVPCSRSRKAE